MHQDTECSKIRFKFPCCIKEIGRSSAKGQCCALHWQSGEHKAIGEWLPPHFENGHWHRTASPFGHAALRVPRIGAQQTFRYLRGSWKPWFQKKEREPWMPSWPAVFHPLWLTLVGIRRTTNWSDRKIQWPLYTSCKRSISCFARQSKLSCCWLSL